MKDAPDQLPVILLTDATSATVPALIAARGQHAGRRFVEFFTANIRNPNTRKAYYRAASEFFDWCDQAGLGLLDIEPVRLVPRLSFDRACEFDRIVELCGSGERCGYVS